MKVVMKLLAMAALTVAWIYPASTRTVQAQGKLPPEYLEHVQEQLQSLAKTTLAPKELAEVKKLVSQWKRGSLKDIPIAADPAVQEYNPSVAANPVNPRLLVAGSEYLTVIDDTTSVLSCVAYSSSDGGVSWSAPIPIPLLSEDSDCQHPVVAYAPDGSRAYYAYLDARLSHLDYPDMGQFRESFDWDIMVRTSEDNGMTWSDPVIALDGDVSSALYDRATRQFIEVDPGFDYLRPWISTPLEPDESSWVYVTATRRENDVYNPQECYIDFASSNDGGTTWNAPIMLDYTADNTICGEFGRSGGSSNSGSRVDGSRPAGGMDGNVLAAWYHSGADRQLQGEFQIRTRYSSDHGATWSDVVVAVTDSEEVQLGAPLETSFPDVELDAQGGAHIAYSRNPIYPLDGPYFDLDWGDIRYIQSSGAPYDAWTAPVTVNDDGQGRLQSWPTLETLLVKGNVYVYLIWGDFRLNPEDRFTWPLYYDIFAAWKRADSATWSANHRITDRSSMWSNFTIGEYFDLAASQFFVYGAWTDRRDMTDELYPNDDIYGSWILPLR